MAIKQTITKISGITAEYHRIAEAQFDLMSRTAVINVSSYLNAEKRDEEKEKEKDEAATSYDPRSIFSSTYFIDVPENDDFTLAFAYGWLKENIYTEAEDC